MRTAKFSSLYAIIALTSALLTDNRSYANDESPTLVDLARQCYEATLSEYTAGTGPQKSRTFPLYYWSKRLLELELESATNSESKQKLCQQHIDRMKELARREANSELDVVEHKSFTQFYVREAEQLLEKNRTNAQGTTPSN